MSERRTRAASKRRVGSESSATRRRLLDCVERLMATRGYAGVTYRAVAAEAGVTAGLVQYYFPTLDDLLVAAIRRRSEENLERLQAKLERDEALRALWSFSTTEAETAIMTEFLALANHRTSIRSEVGEVTRRVREVEFSALDGARADATITLELSPRALVFLVTAIPKLLQLEQAAGVTHGHDEIVEAIERHLARRGEQPRQPATARTRTRRSRDTSAR